MHEIEKELADQRARVSILERELRDIKTDLKAIRSKTDRWSGQVALFVLAIPAGIAAIVTWLLGKLPGG